MTRQTQNQKKGDFWKLTSAKTVSGKTLSGVDLQIHCLVLIVSFDSDLESIDRAPTVSIAPVRMGLATSSETANDFIGDFDFKFALAVNAD
jgi:hypothetical protein